MAHADFVHLRVHSAYSLSEGAIRIKDLVSLCQDMRMPAVAITDTNNLFGALEFSAAAKDAGIQPIIGCQLGLTRGDGGRPAARNGEPDADPIVLLAQNAEGYRHLLKLLGRAHFGDGQGELPVEPFVTHDDLSAFGAGLIALTGGAAGPVGRLLAEGQGAAAEVVLARLAAAFPGRLYVELQRHGLAVERQTEPGLIDLAYRLDLPLVATNEAFFAGPGMFEAHDALLCIAEGTYLSQEDRRRLTPEHYLKSARDMRRLFADLPEAVDNTLVIARRCAFMVEKVKPILPPFPCADGLSEAEELKRQAEAGLEERLARQVNTPAMTPAERDAAAKP